MMLPILISVSVAPASYFFWAIAPVLIAANTIMVADSTCSRSRTAGTIDLPGLERIILWLARYWASKNYTRTGVDANQFWLWTAIASRLRASNRHRADPIFAVASHIVGSSSR